MTRRRRDQMRRLHAVLEVIGASDFAAALAQVDDVLALAHPVREAIVNVLVHEFAARGLRPDSEPNSYGLERRSLSTSAAWRLMTM